MTERRRSMSRKQTLTDANVWDHPEAEGIYVWFCTNRGEKIPRDAAAGAVRSYLESRERQEVRIKRMMAKGLGTRHGS